MKLRDATCLDAEGIAEVERAAAAHPWSTEAVRTSLERPTTRAYVLDADGVVGHLLASLAADEGEVLTFAVHPAHQRRGLGAQLLRHCCAQWSHQGVRQAHLEVRADNGPALALYRHIGWTEVGRRATYYPDGSDAIVLRWTAP